MRNLCFDGQLASRYAGLGFRVQSADYIVENSRCVLLPAFQTQVAAADRLQSGGGAVQGPGTGRSGRHWDLGLRTWLEVGAWSLGLRRFGGKVYDWKERGGSEPILKRIAYEAFGLTT